jgi:hypothetical protein
MQTVSPSPWNGTTMAKNRTAAKNGASQAVDMELKMLRLAADAADLRRLLTSKDLARVPRLARALDACEALFEELGWGNPSDPPGQDDEFEH